MKIQLTGTQIALIAAAVARVEGSEANAFKVDEHLEKISGAVGAVAVDVYDIGPYKNKTRFLRFTFAMGEQIEVEVGPQPEFKLDTRPEGDDDIPPGGTPVAMRMVA